MYRFECVDVIVCVQTSNKAHEAKAIDRLHINTHPLLYLAHSTWNSISLSCTLSCFLNLFAVCLCINGSPSCSLSLSGCFPSALILGEMHTWKRESTLHYLDPPILDHNWITHLLAEVEQERKCWKHSHKKPLPWPGKWMILPPSLWLDLKLPWQWNPVGESSDCFKVQPQQQCLPAGHLVRSTPRHVTLGLHKQRSTFSRKSACLRLNRFSWTCQCFQSESFHFYIASLFFSVCFFTL